MTDVFNVGLPQQAIASLTSAQQTEVLQAVSDEMDGYFRNRWGYGSVPFTTFDSAVTLCAARMAAFRLVVVRGFRSNSPQDMELRKGYEDAITWLKAVEHQQITPNVVVATANAAGSQQPSLITSSVVDLSTGVTAPTRGW